MPRSRSFPVEEPSPNLVTASRMRLQEELETTEQGGFWQRLVFDPGAWLRPIKLAPALAAAIFIVGFAGGIGATYQVMNGRNPVDLTSATPTESSITGIQSISQQPGSSQISIRYNTVSTQEAQGSLNDQRIQQLLLFATRNNYNSGVRMDSVDLLTQTPNDTRVREALLYALRYDSNPGVRLKAIEGLGSYVKDDVRVRNAVLEALVNDSNPGLRTQALHLLEPCAPTAACAWCCKSWRRTIRTCTSARRPAICWPRRQRSIETFVAVDRSSSAWARKIGVKD